MTTPVRQNLTAVTRDDARATLEMVNIQTGSETLIAVAPENPQFSVFGAALVNTPARQILVDDQNMAYSIGVSGLSVIPVYPTGTAPRPAITACNRGVHTRPNRARRLLRCHERTAARSPRRLRRTCAPNRAILWLLPFGGNQTT